MRFGDITGLRIHCLELGVAVLIGKIGIGIPTNVLMRRFLADCLGYSFVPLIGYTTIRRILQKLSSKPSFIFTILGLSISSVSSKSAPAVVSKSSTILLLAS
jgi:hypothetical protein